MDLNSCEWMDVEIVAFRGIRVYGFFRVGISDDYLTRILV